MSGDVRAEMCERRCANRDEFLTQGLQGSAQCFAGASRHLITGMCERGCASGDVRAGMVFNAGFAVF